MTSPRALIPLLLFTLALSLATVALIVNGALRAPRAEDVAELCSERFATAIQPTECPEPEITPLDPVVVPASVYYPGFFYPVGWNVLGEVTALPSGGTRTEITLSSGGLFLLSCGTPDACPLQPQTILTLSQEPFALEGSETLDTHIQARYSTIPNADIQKELFGGNKTKYTINGISPSEGPFLHIVVFGATSKAEVLLPESDLLPAGVAERDAFLSSLDFSLIP